MNKMLEEKFDPSSIDVFELLGASPTFSEAYIFLNPFTILLINYLLDRFFRGEQIYKYWVAEKLIQVLHLCLLVPLYFLFFYIDMYSYRLVGLAVDFFLNIVILVGYNLTVFGILPWVCFALVKDY